MSIQSLLFLAGLLFVGLLVWGARSYDRMQERKRKDENLRHCRKLEEKDVRGRNAN